MHASEGRKDRAARPTVRSMPDGGAEPFRKVGACRVGKSKAARDIVMSPAAFDYRSMDLLLAFLGWLVFRALRFCRMGFLAAAVGFLLLLALHLLLLPERFFVTHLPFALFPCGGVAVGFLG